MGDLLVSTRRRFCIRTFSLRLLLVNNVRALTKCQGHRGLDTILAEIEDLDWDIFPCNESIRISLLLGFDTSYDIDNSVTRG